MVARKLKCPKCDYEAEIEIQTTIKLPFLPLNSDSAVDENHMEQFGIDNIKEYIAYGIVGGESLDHEYAEYMMFKCPKCGEKLIGEVPTVFGNCQYTQPFPAQMFSPTPDDITIVMD